MNIQKIILFFLLIGGSISCVGKTPSLTLEQRLLVILQKYHMGDHKWILNSIVTVLPVYFVTKKILKVLDFIERYFGTLQEKNNTCLSCSVGSRPMVQSIPLNQKMSTSPNTSVVVMKKDPSDRIPVFNFGLMCTLLIWIQSVIELGSVEFFKS